MMDRDTDYPAPPASQGIQATTGEGAPDAVEAHAPDLPTASHGLAEAAATEKPIEDRGYAELDHGEPEILDAGWNEPPDKVPRPLVGGLSNEQVWLLVRRFNKQIYHVKSIPEPPIGNLDFYIAEDEEFSPDKLRAHLERFYMVVVVSLFAFWKHIVRLRSWREQNRTLGFLGVYAIAWLLDFVVPICIAFVMILVLFPASRNFCFPPAPPSAIDPSTGKAKKPSSGVLASADSVTGAPQKHSGEAVEQEAHNFVASISALVVSMAAGKHPQGDPHDDEAGAPDPTAATTNITDAKSRAAGNEPGHHHDKTKQAVSASVWAKASPVMRGLSDFVDTCERFNNALSPTPPFPKDRPRLILTGVLAPMLLASLFTTSYMVQKGLGLSVGFIFFGDPVLQKALAFINRTYPRWKKYVELQNTILKGVPTNAQLTITLLRIGERNKAPLPPPPGSNIPPPVEADEGAEEQLSEIGMDDVEIIQASKPNAEVLDTPEQAGNTTENSDGPKHGKGHRIMNFLKGTTRGGINTSVATDKLKAKVGAKHAKDRLGVIKKEPDPAAGPVQFPARWRGKKGHAYITTTATTPALSWTSELSDLNPAWTVAVADIDEIRKVGGLGWKSKLLVGWATEREVADGLIIKDRQGNEDHLTAIITRDVLFNRLVAMGEQMWEAR